MPVLEYKVIHSFFEEEHLITRQLDDEERVKCLKPPSWYAGGKVPKAALYRADNIKLLRFELIPAVDIVHKALDRVNSLAKTKYDDKVGIRLIPKILHACERRRIPQNFAPGLLLLYLEHCEGCAWRDLLCGILQKKLRVLKNLENDRLKIKQLIDEGKIFQAQLIEDTLTYDWPEYTVAVVADFFKEAQVFFRRRIIA